MEQHVAQCRRGGLFSWRTSQFQSCLSPFEDANKTAHLIERELPQRRARWREKTRDLPGRHLSGRDVNSMAAFFIQTSILTMRSEVFGIVSHRGRQPKRRHAQSESQRPIDTVVNDQGGEAEHQQRPQVFRCNVERRRRPTQNPQIDRHALQEKDCDEYRRGQDEIDNPRFSSVRVARCCGRAYSECQAERCAPLPWRGFARRVAPALRAACELRSPPFGLLWTC